MTRYEQMVECRNQTIQKWARRPDLWWDVLYMDPMPEDELWFEKATSYHMTFDDYPGEQLHLYVSVPPFAKGDSPDRIFYAGRAADDVASVVILDATRARPSTVIHYGKSGGKWSQDLTKTQQAALQKKLDALKVGYVLS